MEHSISPKITDAYNPKADNIYTLKDWHKQNEIVTMYLISDQSLVPIFVLVSSFLAILYFLYAKTHSFGERINTLSNSDHSRDEGFEMRSNLYIITSTSIMFSVYAIMMSIIACSKGKDDVHKEFKKWFNTNETYFKDLFHLSTAILIEDILYSSVIFIGVVTSIVINIAIRRANDSNDYGCIAKCICIVNKCKDIESFHWELHVFFLLLPITTVAVHGNHILIGFIHTPYHATGIGTLYGIVIVTCIAILKIIHHLLYQCVSRMRMAQNNYTSVDEDQSKCNIVTEYFVLLLVSVGVIAWILLFSVFIIALYFLLPINIAIDEAPNRLSTIYQGSVLVFAGFVTYWIVIKQNKSPLSSFIRAKDKDKKGKGEWKKKTYQEKEEEVANIILKHYGNVTVRGQDGQDPPGQDPSGQDPPGQDPPGQ